MIPLKNRCAVAAAMSLAFLIAGWGKSWWLLGPVVVPWGLVALGVWDERRERS